MPEQTAPATLLAFDFGMKRIGVAVGESLLATARPLTTIAVEAKVARFAAIEKLLQEWQPQRLVVGLPSNEDGSEHVMSAHCRRFAQQLAGRFKLPVDLVDERFSSTAAEEMLRERGMSWQDRKRCLDAEAACLILESYFHEQATHRS